MVEVNVTITDNHGNTISLAHGDVANVQYLLDKMVKRVGYVFTGRAWTNEELAALDKPATLEKESPGTLREDAQHLCYVGCDCFRSHI